jgi:ribonucleotide reductase alpha subunit
MNSDFDTNTNNNQKTNNSNNSNKFGKFNKFNKMDETNDMCVIKRNGEKELVSFDKVSNRLRNLATENKFNKKLKLNFSKIAQKVCTRVYDGVSTTELDELAGQICASMGTDNPDYSILASRIVISNHHKNTSPSFSETIYILYNNTDIHGKHSPLISKQVYDIVMENKNKLNDVIDYNKDFTYDYFGFKTLERAYLMKVKGKIVERPQHMLMRVAIGIHLDDFKDALNTQKYMSEGYFIHATPTLFNSGTPHPQMSSCFLMTISDSISGIYKTISDCADISQGAGGIGFSTQGIRAKGSHIRGTNGKSNGIVPMLRVFNNTARYVDQCVVPETIIYTTKGPMEIKDCIANETDIFTTNGTEVIENVLEHSYEGEILSINNNKLKITGEHPVYCLKNIDNLKKEELKNKLYNKAIKPEWIDAKDLTTDDFLIHKIPTYDVDMENITCEDCYMYGLLLSRGTLNNVSVYESQITTSKFINQYLTNKCVKYEVSLPTNNMITFSWKHNTLLPFRTTDLQNSNKQKHVSNKFINLPIHKSKFIIKGLINEININKCSFDFGIENKLLENAIKYILLKMNVLTVNNRDTQWISSIRYNNWITINKKDGLYEFLEIDETIYAPYDEECIVKEDNNELSYFHHDDLLFTKIVSIEKETYSGTLYDLQMKDTHNYMLESGIVHNGGGKRNGSFASYIEPWHADIFAWLDLKKNHGSEEDRARDLFYGLWIPDLFMERVEQNGKWTLMCPDECPNLHETYGEEFNTLYEKYEAEGKGKKTINAQDLWSKIVISQIETGTPYMLYKDACNAKSNQQNLGTIKSSNLCTEIIEYTSPEEIAVCNLASIGLPKFLEEDEEKMAQQYVIYTKSNCSFCNIAKMLFKSNDIKYIEKNLDDKDIRDYFFQTLRNQYPEKEFKTVPQIFAYDCDEEIKGDEYDSWFISNGKLIGGCNELLLYLQPTFNFNKLIEVSKIITKNLNKIIDRNYYPLKETVTSNKRHRPIGIGIQGLADVYARMRIPFASEQAQELNKQIFETIYYGATCASMEISKKREPMIKRYCELLEESIKGAEDHIDKQYVIDILDTIINNNSKHIINNISNKDINQFKDNKYNELLELHKILLVRHEEIDRNKYLGSYSSFEGSPMHQGKFQFNLWDENIDETKLMHDWSPVRRDINKYGIRNSLLIAPMPTASTSQILGNNECFEPFTSNIYSRRTLAGDFIMTNKYLMKDLIDLDLWSKDMKEQILLNDGSIARIKEIPDMIKENYKIVWEISQKVLIDYSADRGQFVCQSQSSNLFLEEPYNGQVTSMHFYAWKKGLKTGMYYLRTQPKSSTQKFTIDPNKETECLSCGS